MKQNEIYIKGKSDNKIITADCGNLLELKAGDEIIFENDQGQDIATVISEDMVKIEEDVEGIKAESDHSCSIIRKLTEKDREKIRSLAEEARKTIAKCQEKIDKYKLSMTLVNAGLSYDEKKLTFYFVAPGRVDFRILVSDLAATFQKLIRLQQVGSRDKARCVGGCGRCGQELCCKKVFNGDIESVTMDMAYLQNLGQMGSARVTGACGKLICCLKYELETYKEAKKKLPELGTTMKTKEGSGIVVGQSVLKNKISVRLRDDRIVEVDC